MSEIVNNPEIGIQSEVSLGTVDMSDLNEVAFDEVPLYPHENAKRKKDTLTGTYYYAPSTKSRVEVFDKVRIPLGWVDNPDVSDNEDNNDEKVEVKEEEKETKCKVKLKKSALYFTSGNYIPRWMTYVHIDALRKSDGTYEILTSAGTSYGCVCKSDIDNEI